MNAPQGDHAARGVPPATLLVTTFTGTPRLPTGSPSTTGTIQRFERTSLTET